MLKKLAVISLTAGALVLCAPAVASAAPTEVAPFASGSYVDPPGVAVDSPVIDVCEVSTVVFGSGYFADGEQVAIGVSGFNAAAASYSGNVANADGGMVLSFRPPADGHGSYALAFDGTRSYTALITVSQGHDAAVSCDHDPQVAASGTELPLTGGGMELPLTGDGMELALTGGGASPWILAGGAAALAAGTALTVAGIARRKRA
ncbi:hypothetical protein [Microbacterium sp. A94]|uniref:hypothetical protein n=1 Tax=Microbacterium sp. A94 TaxID=3450717 RepID=UPI003F4262C2